VDVVFWWTIVVVMENWRWMKKLIGVKVLGINKI